MSQTHHEMPAKDCPFCDSRMVVDENLDTLVGAGPSHKVDASEAVPVATYACPGCGFVAAFNAVTLGAHSEL